MINDWRTEITHLIEYKALFREKCETSACAFKLKCIGNFYAENGITLTSSNAIRNYADVRFYNFLQLFIIMGIR